MDRAYFKLAITLNECCNLALAAGKNAHYMDAMLSGDPSIVEYANKLHLMDQELNYLLQRAEELRRILQEFTAIAMR